jgi:hypothetical protein
MVSFFLLNSLLHLKLLLVQILCEVHHRFLYYRYHRFLLMAWHETRPLYYVCSWYQVCTESLVIIFPGVDYYHINETSTSFLTLIY